MLLLLLFGFVYSIDVFGCQELFGSAATARGEYCYIDIGMSAQWPAAEAACVAKGGHLPVVHDMETNNFLASTFGNIWLGGQEPVENSGWFWVDGSHMDFTNWAANEPNDHAGREDYIELYSSGKWNDIYNDQSEKVVCQVMGCTNYEGGYVAGKAQCGFDDEQFKGDYSGEGKGIDDIDSILEEMETGFEDEAIYWEGQVDAAFGTKESSYLAVTAAEQTYADRMTERVAQEGLYNAARIAEEAAHADLLVKIDAYNAAVQAHIDVHADYVEKIDFLNYELFIIQQIRELLGEKIGYTPHQVILEKIDYDVTYDGWTTAYPGIHTSAFSHENQRFGKRRKRRRRRRRKRTLKAKKRRRRRR